MRACKEGVQSANAESFRLMILDTFASLALRWPRDGAALLTPPTVIGMRALTGQVPWSTSCRSAARLYFTAASITALTSAHSPTSIAVLLPSILGVVSFGANALLGMV